MEATKCLRDEHQLILRVLDCFQIAMRNAEESGSVTSDVFEPFIVFFRDFADKCHHCKEESRLFPRLEVCGVPREGGPIGVMVQEHEQARVYVRTIAKHLEAADAGDETAAGIILEQGRSLVDLLRAHINKENQILFAVADQLIKGTDLIELNDAFDNAESESGYCDTLNRCRTIANQLMDSYEIERQ